MVALSQVNRDEASEVFRAAALPAIRPDAEPEILQAALALYDRWQLPLALPGDLGDLLLRRLLAESDWRRQRRLLSAIEALPSTVRISSPVAQDLATRLANERDLAAADILLGAFLAAAPASQPDLARTLAAPIDSAPVTMLPLLAEALGALGDGLPKETASLAATTMALRIRSAERHELAAVLAGGLGELAAAAVPEPFEDAGNELVTRMEATRDPYSLALLASGLNAIASPIRTGAAAHLATRLQARVSASRDPAETIRLLIGLHAVARAWSPEDAARFASQMRARMDAARGDATRRIYAFGLHAVDSQAAAPILAEYLKEEAASEPGNLACLPGPDRAALAAQILNPRCSESEWNTLVLAFARVTSQQVASEGPESGPSLEELAGVDNDDGAAAPPDGGVAVDFDKLSAALDPFRTGSQIR